MRKLLAPPLAPTLRLSTVSIAPPAAVTAAWLSQILTPASAPRTPLSTRKKFDQTDHADKLIGDTQEFRSAVPISRCLGELLKLQASNKISPRRATVVAYTCNLLLRTLPAIELELHPAHGEPSRWGFSDWPDFVTAGAINRLDQTS
ncbi:MAG TPA: hypothetical protein VIW93_12885 [Candidatus Acidoferrum sp.]